MKQQVANAIFPGFLGAALIWAMWGIVDREVSRLCFAGAGLILMMGTSIWYRCTHDEHGRVVYPAKCLRFLTAEVKWQLFNAFCLGFVYAALISMAVGVFDGEMRRLWLAGATLMLMFGASTWWTCTHDADGQPLKPVKYLLDEL
jgi:hypothetical protein